MKLSDPILKPTIWNWATPKDPQTRNKQMLWLTEAEKKSSQIHSWAEKKRVSNAVFGGWIFRGPMGDL